MSVWGYGCTWGEDFEGYEEESTGNPDLDCLLLAAGYKKFEVMKAEFKRLRDSLDLHGADRDCGLMHLAAGAYHDNADKVRYLIQKGFSVNQVNSQEQTPLHFAYDSKVAQLLFEHGAMRDATDKDGMTPLHQAVRDNREQVVEYLIRSGADLYKPNKVGETPYYTAINNCHKKTIALLETATLVDRACFVVASRWADYGDKLEEVLPSELNDICLIFYNGVMHYERLWIGLKDGL